ncbi:MAG: outer membrane protein assembly factor BamA [Candidatus Portiera sp.]|nr:outer membrane protein assembly factor BamA [Portiera sp.]
MRKYFATIVFIFGCLGCLIPNQLLAQELLKEIRIEGIQRVTYAKLLASTDLRQGRNFNEKDISKAIKDIFNSGYYSNVDISHKNGIVNIQVTELPSINEISVKGSKLIKEQQILDVLEDGGIRKGEILKNTEFEIILKELTALYAQQGRYGTKIEGDLEELEGGNRVNININIIEGTAAKITKIKIAGNKAFKDRELKSLLSLKEIRRFNSNSAKVKYSRTALIADIDTLTRYYLNNGYARVVVSNNIVSINRKKDLIAVYLEIDEGKKYTINKINIIGNTIVPREDLLNDLNAQASGLFRQSDITRSSDLIINRLGIEGYGLAKVNTRYEYNDLLGIIDVNFYVLPGQKTYIRNIEITGNKKSKHTALRRYLSQYEGSPYSTIDVQRSLAAIRRLPYIASVQVERRAIPNKPDQLDLIFIIEEAQSGNVGGGLFYSDVDGVSLSFSYSDANFYGSGNSLSGQIKYGRISQELGFNLRQPFINIDGVSANYFLNFRSIDFDQANIANYALLSTRVGVGFGYPISFTDRINYGLSFSNTNIATGSSARQEIGNYTDRHGSSYLDAAFTTTISHNSLNRGFKPTKGHRTSLSTGLRFPLDNNNRVPIYESSLYHISYVQLDREIDELAFSFGFSVNFFDTWYEGDNLYLPFYNHYFAGGTGSVRGFASSSLGPRGTGNNGRATSSSQGGNLRALGRTEFIFPLGAATNSVSNLRSSIFWDLGNVFNTRCIIQEPYCEIPVSYDQLRQSVGLSLRWYIQLFPLAFSISKPLNARDDDRTMDFQFSFGNIN